jgi:hypothetical protein
VFPFEAEFVSCAARNSQENAVNELTSDRNCERETGKAKRYMQSRFVKLLNTGSARFTSLLVLLIVILRVHQADTNMISAARPFLRVKKLTEFAQLPLRGTSLAAGYDLCRFVTRS